MAKMLSKYEASAKSINIPLFHYLWPGLQEFFPDLLPINIITVKVNGIPRNHITVPGDLETEVCRQPHLEDCEVFVESPRATYQPFTVLDQRIVMNAILVVAKFKEMKKHDLDISTAKQLMERMESMLIKMDTKIDNIVIDKKAVAELN
jgi:hypothetical protein